MSTHLTAAIAWRYLFSKKSHAAVGTISTVSVCAMAVATAAIICVLSVFNGFKEVIGSRLDTLAPDIMVTPARGKVFEDAEVLAARLAKLPQVSVATPTLSDNALIICNSQEMPVTLKGVVPEEYARVTSVKSLIPKDYGEYISSGQQQSSQVPVILSIGSAARLGAYPGDEALIFAPKREGRVNLANPAASFFTNSIQVSGVYQSDQQQYDRDGVIIPIQAARDLFQYDSQASAIEILLKPGVDPASAEANIRHTLGDEYVVKDRMKQQEMNFRMVSIEKWVSFMLLVFILVIACFNLISALSMLVLEKENSMSVMSSMGMSKQRIGAVFAWESIFVSAAGGISGILLGLGLCLLQQHFGLIQINDAANSIVHSYPVAVKPIDILITLVPVIALGLVTALVTAAFARRRIQVL